MDQLRSLIQESLSWQDPVTEATIDFHEKARSLYGRVSSYENLLALGYGVSKLPLRETSLDK